MEYDVDVESDSESVSSSDQELQDKYAKKYDVLSRKCDGLQKENHMLVLRLFKVKKRVQRLRKERKFLIKILDQYGDKFRSIPLNIPLDENKVQLSIKSE
ncbi:UNVERIFIED_CONTAM: hypothetical protein RMT77_006094 [Armadillidium vulgare]|nr:TCF3 fusion partner-like protein [Armadillidium vulgare]